MVIPLKGELPFSVKERNLFTTPILFLLPYQSQAFKLDSLLDPMEDLLWICTPESMTGQWLL